MDISKKQLKRIMNQYYNLSASGVDCDDVQNVFSFISDVLKAEAEAAQAKEPFWDATKSVRDYEIASVVVNNLFYDILDKLEESEDEQ